MSRVNYAQHEQARTEARFAYLRTILADVEARLGAGGEPVAPEALVATVIGWERSKAEDALETILSCFRAIGDTGEFAPATWREALADAEILTGLRPPEPEEDEDGYDDPDYHRAGCLCAACAGGEEPEVNDEPPPDVGTHEGVILREWEGWEQPDENAALAAGRDGW